MLETSPTTNINNSTGVSTATALAPVTSSDPVSVASSKKLKPSTGTSSVKEAKAGSFFSRLFLRLCGAPDALKEEENTTPNPSDNSPKITAKEMETTQPQVDLKEQREGPTEMQKTSISSLLPPLDPRDIGKKCLVLDLDETLVHSSFQPVQPVDYVIPVEIDGQMQNVYVLKRPGVDEFLAQVGKWYEVVVFTASLSKYADPVMDLLDIGRVVRHRLFREACSNHGGSFVKDLSLLGRDLANVIIVDNSPTSYILHPTNAAPVSSWFNDLHDSELLDLGHFLEDIRDVDDVTVILNSSLH